jgi:protoporphyrinogen oxidase
MRTAIIIGAGPAGLTAAYELLLHTDIVPIVLEASADTGGLSKTVNYKGNRMDIGGHRFFSKSKTVMDWWQHILPVEADGGPLTITYHNQQTTIKPGNNAGEDTDDVLLVRNRLSRIYFLGKFFGYPLALNGSTIKNLGIVRITRIGFSYLWAKLFPIKNEITLEDFFINRFGKELYRTFFKDYTEKVWGVPTSSISAAWGAQRIKSLSLLKTIRHAIFKKKNKEQDINQSGTETSLIEKFLYPKFGPGHLWETVAKHIIQKGGQIIYNQQVSSITNIHNTIAAVTALDKTTGVSTTYKGDYFISTMPVKDLVAALTMSAPAEVLSVSNNLVYRDFITVGLLLKNLTISNPDGSPVKDNWIYIQEKTVLLGRLQIFNNWSPAMVADENTVWLGLEYFCNEGDELWNKSDADMLAFAKAELEAIKIIQQQDVLDGTVIRMPKTYPSYIGAYEQFDTIRNYIDGYHNLFLIGRNGMHKYNNQDHSMLTAMQAIQHIKNGVTDKAAIWEINTEDDYHEE